MVWFSGGENRPSLLKSTIKTVAAIAFLSYFAAHWLSSGLLDRAALARLAANIAAPQGGTDPTTTGSLAQAANGAKLDPCLGLRRP